jgi:DNA-binding MarR family transcriptional regulator
MTTNTRDHDQTSLGLSRIGAFLRSAQWRAAETLGLTPTQIDALTLLKRRGASRLSDLAKHLGVTQATASDAVAALHRKALVRKQPDPADGRAVVLTLTPPGEEIAAGQDRPPRALADALSSLDAGEHAALRRALVKIIRELQVAGAIEPQRLCVSCEFFRPHAHPGSTRPHHCAFVDAAFGDAELRTDCGDHEDAGETDGARHWRRFSTAPPAE